MKKHYTKHRFKTVTLVLLTLSLCACGDGGGKGHADRGDSTPPLDETPAPQEFGDLVARLVQQQDDTAEPEEINPDTLSYHANDNEAEFDHLF